MVITGGENVYPAEVAVIGLLDDRWGETVSAIVVANDKLPTLEELRDFAGVELAPYKLPRQLHVVDALPRNLAGKVLKFELRERFTARPS